MKWGFILITILGAIHYDYGSDYMSYYNTYREIVNLPFDLKAIMAGDYYRDTGWALLAFFFKPFGGSS